MKVVYISGAIEGGTDKSFWQVEQNIRTAEMYYVRMLRTGKLAPICPHTMGRFLSGCVSRDTFLYVDNTIITRCCDGLFLLPGWQLSPGAIEEKRIAEDFNIPVFQKLSTLYWWAGIPEENANGL